METKTLKRKKIFIVCPVVPLPVCGYGARVISMIDYLRSEGYKISLFICGHGDDQETISFLSEHCDNLFYDSGAKSRARSIVDKFAYWGMAYIFNLITLGWQYPEISFIKKHRVMPASFMRLIQCEATKEKPHAIISNYYFSSLCFRGLRKMKLLKIVDTHDVFWLRGKKIINSFGIKLNVNVSKKLERRFLNYAGTIIAIQPLEQAELISMLPKKHVICAGKDFDFRQRHKSIKANHNVILLVASDNPMNIAGLRGFINKAWPEVLKCNKGARLRVVGNIADKFAYSLNDRSIEFVGWKRDLGDEYMSAGVVINPTFAGTGLKIKTIEALGYGKAFVTWPEGIAGLERAPRDTYMVCRSWAEFAQAILNIQADGGKRPVLEKRAKEFAMKNFSQKAVYSELDDLLNGIRQ